MSARKKSNYIPPCPDPDLYVLIQTKDGAFWRRKRGTVTPARLNSAFKQNVSNSKIASPAAKRIVQKLQPFLRDLNTGRLTVRLSGVLIKTINQKGAVDFSLMTGFEFQEPPLGRILRARPELIIDGLELTVQIAIQTGMVGKPSDRVKDFYIEAILVYGDVTIDNGLRIDSTISQLYAFDDPNRSWCELRLQLPEGNISWMVILKVTCQEADRLPDHKRYFGMRVVGGM